MLLVRARSFYIFVTRAVQKRPLHLVRTHFWLCTNANATASSGGWGDRCCCPGLKGDSNLVRGSGVAYGFHRDSALFPKRVHFSFCESARNGLLAVARFVDCSSLLFWRSHGSKTPCTRSAVCTHVHRGPAIFHCQSTSSDPDIRKEPWLCGGIYLRRRREERLRDQTSKGAPSTTCGCHERAGSVQSNSCLRRE